MFLINKVVSLILGTAVSPFARVRRLREMYTHKHVVQWLFGFVFDSQVEGNEYFWSIFAGEGKGCRWREVSAQA
jgi:hypothetical protein